MDNEYIVTQSCNDVKLPLLEQLTKSGVFALFRLFTMVVRKSNMYKLQTV